MLHRHYSLGILLSLILSLTFTMASPRVSRADNLPPDKLKAVKNATVLVRVTLPNTQVVSGSGFFALEPGLIVTNAHVLGMLDPDSRRPQKVEIVIRSGETDAKTITAEVVGADRGQDLGIVRVKGDNLPAPLTPETATELLETDEVYAFGFPFGERLGKNITVAKTSVSSLRKTSQGTLDRIQVSGGIHPGNSGGPVIDSKGRLVGISVSGIKNTQIQFAIPVEHLKRYLNGRVSTITRDLPYRDGDKILQPVRIETLDPLGKLQKLQIEYFTGNNGPPRNSSDKQPAPLAKDSPIKVFDLKYDTKTGLASCDVELTPLEGSDLRHFYRPVITDGDGKTRWYGVVGEVQKYIMTRVPQSLTFKPGSPIITPAEIVSNGQFKIRSSNDEEFSIGLNLKTRYNENCAEPIKKYFPLRVEPTLFAFSILKDNKPLPSANDLKDIARDFPLYSAEILREEDGNWYRSRGDVSKVPARSRSAATDLGTQLLQSLEVVSLPLPNREMKPMETWKSRRDVVVGASSLDMGMSGIGDYLYTYLGTTELKGKKVAYVRIEGTIRGKLGDGLDLAGRISGRADIDPATGEASSVDVTLKADADIVTTKKDTIKIMGTLSVQLRRGELPPLGPPKK